MSPYIPPPPSSPSLIHPHNKVFYMLLIVQSGSGALDVTNNLDFGRLRGQRGVIEHQPCAFGFFFSPSGFSGEHLQSTSLKKNLKSHDE